MTWAAFEDHYTRLLPYLIPLRSGRKIDEATIEKLERPFKVKKPPKKP